MASRRKFTEEEVAGMVTAYTGNEKGLNTIAREFDCSVTTVSRLLKSRGITLRGRGRPKGKTKVSGTQTGRLSTNTTSTDASVTTRPTFTFNNDR